MTRPTETKASSDWLTIAQLGFAWFTVVNLMDLLGLLDRPPRVDADLWLRRNRITGRRYRHFLRGEMHDGRKN